MHWSLYILIGAIINAVVNWGYKIMNGKVDMFVLSAVMYGTGAIGFLIVALLKGTSFQSITQNSNWIIPVTMGFAAVACLFFFFNAITKGPISLVDPLWACIYALASAAIGLCVLKEHPSAISLCGVGLYLVGAFLMAKG